MISRTLYTCVLILAVAGAAHAQTTVTLNTPSNATDTVIRGGTYAAVNFSTTLLATKASAD